MYIIVCSLVSIVSLLPSQSLLSLPKRPSPSSRFSTFLFFISLLSTRPSPSSHHARRSVARRQTTALRCHRSQLCQRRRTPRSLSPLLPLTSTQRRKFHAVLISLPTAPSASYESKTFFGTLVHKFFAEFEDLQDAAIDALLDLCEDEDEKVRMIGIRALGPTARADPRWVRGNTGVLLQLLASRAFSLRWAVKLLTTLA